MSSNNNSSNNSGKSAGIGFVGLLGLVFIVLKLCGVITWSWIWVLSPIWIPVVFVLSITIIFFIIGLIFSK